MIVHGMKDCVDCLILKNWLILYDIPFRYIEDIKKGGGLAPYVIINGAVFSGLDECLERIEIEYDIKFENNSGRAC